MFSDHSRSRRQRSTLQSARLKSSRTDTVAENGNHHQRKPRVVGTSDTEGASIDLPATPGYQDTELTTGDLESELVADGGSELEADVFLCGECERIFTAEDILSSYTIEATGEQVSYSIGSCPDCDTLITDDRTLRTTATFDLIETEVDR